MKPHHSSTNALQTLFYLYKPRLGEGLLSSLFFAGDMLRQRDSGQRHSLKLERIIFLMEMYIPQKQNILWEHVN